MNKFIKNQTINHNLKFSFGNNRRIEADAHVGHFDLMSIDADNYEILNVVKENDYQLINDAVEQKALALIEQLIYNRDNYKNMSNEALCVLYQKGDSHALSELIINNSTYIQKYLDICGKIDNHCFDTDDLFHHGVIGLIEGANKWDSN